MPLEETSENTSEVVARMKGHLSGFETEEGRRKGLAFKPRKTDVFVTTTPKAGKVSLASANTDVLILRRHNLDATDCPSASNWRGRGHGI